MTDQQINEAMAKLEGWEHYPARPSLHQWKSPGGTFWASVPLYTKDLNAVHRVVEKLEEPHWTGFGYQLRKLILGDADTSFRYADFAAVSNATARQRCEAILRTLNLWQE